MNKSKLNIVFIGHDLKFLFPLIEHLQSKDMFELRIIQHSCHEIIDEAEAQNALKGRIKTSKWCQALSILIGVIKLIGLAFLLFSPLNVLVAIGFAVGAVAILCTVAIVAYDSYNKKKFKI